MEKVMNVEVKKGESFFKALARRKREVQQHLANGGKLTDLQGKNHDFVQPV